MKSHDDEYYCIDDEDYWLELVEHDLAQGWPTIKIPRTSFSMSVAIALADRLEASVKSVGKDYVFSKSPVLKFSYIRH